MRKIEAVVRPDQLYAVLTALHEIPEMPAFTVTEARVFPHGHTDALCETQGADAIHSVDMMKIECVVPPALGSAVMDAIARAMHLENQHQGLVIAYEVEGLVRDRSGLR